MYFGLKVILYGTGLISVLSPIEPLPELHGINQKRHPQPEEIISCYKNLVAAVYNKLGCTLVLSRKIVWTNVPDEIQQEIQCFNNH